MKGLKKILPIVAIVAMLAWLMPMPTVVLAGTGTGPVTGNVTAQNNTPSIGAVSLSPATITPQSSANITIPVTDNNTLNNISEIYVVLGYQGTSDNSTLLTKLVGNCTANTTAIYKWTPSANWTIVGPTTNESWDVGTGTTPTLTNTTGSFVLNFTAGKVAYNSDYWDMHIKVSDNNTATDTDITTLNDKTMNAYGEITTSPSAISFGSLLPPVSDVAITTGSGNYTAISYVNKTYELQINTTSTWADDGNTIALTSSDPAALTDQFRLEVDDDGSVAGAQNMTNSAAGITDHSADGPSPDEDSANAANTVDVCLWMDLGYVTDIGTYTGTITMTVSY